MGTAGDVQRPMDMVEWEVFYSNIINRFSIDFFADNKSAEMLDKLTGSVHTSEHLLKNFIERRTCIVYGAGPTLAATPTEILCNTNFTHVAADGSARLFLDRKVRLPDILVTDLDGGYETVMACAPKSVIVLHAHGDNMDKIKRVVPRLLKLKTKMVLTTETVQKGKVKNFFGFTDGDRAAWLCRYFNAKRIILAGMDFDSDTGEYSKPTGTIINQDRKRAKLEIGKQLIMRLSQESVLTTAPWSTVLSGLSIEKYETFYDSEPDEMASEFMQYAIEEANKSLGNDKKASNGANSC